MKRTALVTGANRGIGCEVVAELARLGHKVWLTGRNREAGESAVEVLRGADLDVHFVHLDLTYPGSIGQASKVVGAIDILVNNGAVLEQGGPLAVDHDALERSVRINLLGATHCLRAFAPGMIDRGWGRVVNVSSEWGAFSAGMTGPMAYSVTKAALNALTLNAAHHFPATVKVNSVCPGWVNSDMGGPGATRTVEQGAAGIVWAATLPDDGPTGGFFRDGRPIAW